MENMMVKAGLVGTLALVLTGTGCATKKYVAQSIAPVEARVSATEKTNGDQDQKLTAQGDQIQSLETDLSRAKERIGDVDSKATSAGAAAQAADQKAQGAQRTADGAQQAANGAQQAADRSLARANEVATTLDRKIDASNKFQMVASEVVLFKVDGYKLDKESQEKLDELAKRATAGSRYIIEVQGFTDKTGSAEYNNRLSQQRAEEVTRYLTNTYEIPLHNITMLGSGYARPVADDKTRDGRKMNRRVEVRLFVPETASQSLAAARD